ncbi:DUF3413 domain-containing, partial [Paramuricea clavata]
GSNGNTPAIRDQQATEDWLNWYANKPQDQPSFSFVFYDAVYGYDFTAEFNQEFSPTAGRIKYAKMADEYGADMEKLYDSSVQYVDSLAGKILDKLEQSSQLENTMVIITGDHGHELNDNGQDFWGHNSNLANSQIKVPFIIIDKNFNQQKPEKICRNLTSHYDLVPTIMKNLLGTTNGASDYSCGVDLFSDFSYRKWVLSSAKKKYLDYFGVIQQDYTIKLLPSGFYQFLDNRNSPIAETEEINYEQINQAFEMVEKFTH